MPVRDLSGGQRQSIAIGRAISFDRRCLFWMSLLLALAVQEVEHVLELVQEVSQRGVSIVFITHRSRTSLRSATEWWSCTRGTNVANLTTSETSMEGLVRSIVGGEPEEAA